MAGACFNCGKTGHWASRCPEPRKPRDKSGDTCRNCGEVGHWATACEKPRVRRCAHCREEGHTKSRCPALKEERKRKAEEAREALRLTEERIAREQERRAQRGFERFNDPESWAWGCGALVWLPPRDVSRAESRYYGGGYGRCDGNGNVRMSDYEVACPACEKRAFVQRLFWIAHNVATKPDCDMREASRRGDAPNPSHADAHAMFPQFAASRQACFDNRHEMAEVMQTIFDMSAQERDALAANGHPFSSSFLGRWKEQSAAFALRDIAEGRAVLREVAFIGDDALFLRCGVRRTEDPERYEEYDSTLLLDLRTDAGGEFLKMLDAITLNGALEHQVVDGACIHCAATLDFRLNEPCYGRNHAHVVIQDGKGKCMRCNAQTPFERWDHGCFKEA